MLCAGERCEIQTTAHFEPSSFIHLSVETDITRIEFEFTSLESDGIILYTVSHSNCIYFVW